MKLSKLLKEVALDRGADNINEATQFTKPSQDGDIYYSEREGKAIGIRKGDSLYHLYVYDGTPKLGKVARSDSRWENMGPASRGLLTDLALKGVGGLYTRDAAVADARIMIQFVSDMTESVNEESMVNEAEGTLKEDISSKVYVVIPFYSVGGDIMENDILVFKNFDTAQRYVDTLGGSPIIISTELK